MSTWFRILSLCLIAGNVFAFQKSEDAYWREVKLPFSLIRGLDERFCTQDQKTYMGCIEAYNHLLSFMNPPRQIDALPPTDETDVIKIGKFALVPLPTEAKSLSPDESKPTLNQLIRKHRKQFEARWKQIWRSGRARDLSFAKLQKLIFKNVIEPAGSQASVHIAEAINSLLRVRFDPHTRWIPSAYMADESSSGERTFGGIGVQIAHFKSQHVITLLTDSGPAQKAGLKPNDVIIEVNSQNVEALDLGQVSDLLRGKEGSEVEVTVKRDQEEDLRTFRIVRSVIRDNNVTHSLEISGPHRFGQIRIRSFTPESTCRMTAEALLDLKRQGMEGLILDLRQNLGGRVDQAMCILGLLIGPNQVGLITKMLPDLKQEVVVRTSLPQVTDVPMVTLIDALSASASEIIAGDLQDYQRSYILGTRSFGKGTVQSISMTEEVFPGVRKIMTIARFYVAGLLPKLGSGGERTNFLVGIHPDIERHSRPEWNEDDVFSFREEDYYVSPEYPADGAWTQPRPQEIESLEACMTRTGVAQKEFAKTSHQLIPADYQFLSALDLLSCKVAPKPIALEAAARNH